MFHDEDAPTPDAWTHTRIDDVPVPRSSDLRQVTSLLDDWIATQTAPGSFEIIVKD